MINYQNHHYFNDGGIIEPHATADASHIVAAADVSGDSQQQLHHHHQQQNGFNINFNNTVVMNINHEEEVGGIDIHDGDNHEILHHGCMIDMEDHDHENQIIIECQGSNCSTTNNAYGNDNEANITLASIHANDHTEISYTNNTSAINENHGENHDHRHDDDDDNCWQVVPDSLDHLSRDELCRIIYRLDYERNALLLIREQQQQQQQQQQLQQQHHDQPQQQPEQPQHQHEQFLPASTVQPNDDHRQDQYSNNYHSGHGNEDNIDCYDASDGNGSKKKQKRKKKKRARGNANGNDSNDLSPSKLPLVDPQSHNPTISAANASTATEIMVHRTNNVDGDDQQQLPHSLQRISHNDEGILNDHVNEVICPIAVEDLRSRLRQSLIDIILSSAIHGGRRIPKSTVAMEGVSYPMARAIVMPRVDVSGSSSSGGGSDTTEDISNMYYDNINISPNNNGNNSTRDDVVYNHMTNNEDGYNKLSVLADTKRMIKWRMTDENYIAKVLGRGEERLIHPVRHDGTGIYVLTSSPKSSSTSSSSSSVPCLMNEGGSDSSHIHNPHHPHQQQHHHQQQNQRTRNGMYHYARFQCLDVKYDKWEKLLTIIAKTVAADEEHGRESVSLSTA